MAQQGYNGLDIVWRRCISRREFKQHQIGRKARVTSQIGSQLFNTVTTELSLQGAEGGEVDQTRQDVPRIGTSDRQDDAARQPEESGSDLVTANAAKKWQGQLQQVKDCEQVFATPETLRSLIS